MNNLKLGFRVHAVRLADIGGDAAKAEDLYKLAHKLVDSLLLSWKPGDGDAEIVSEFECKVSEHKHEP